MLTGAIYKIQEAISMIHYAIYFTWNDGTEDSCIEYGAKSRNITINELLANDEIIKVSYCKIYKSGEYGIHKIIK